MANVTPLHPADDFLPAVDAATEQDRARLALFALRDLLEAAPPLIAFDPQGVGALVGMIAEMLPSWPPLDD